MHKMSLKQIAVMNIQYKYFPLTKFLNDAVKNGVKNIELWGATPHFHMEDMRLNGAGCIWYALRRSNASIRLTWRHPMRMPGGEA